MVDGYVGLLQDANARIHRLHAALRLVLAANESVQSSTQESRPAPAVKIPEMQPAIYNALLEIEPKCADYYAQVCLDFADRSRVSWIGTVHQVRETLATMLRMLAPDNDVVTMSWFKPETKDGRPTQKQRVRFIMQNRGAGTAEREVAEQVDLIEDRVASMVRSTYSRASNAAHTGAERREAMRILRYFEAFAHDLLDLE